MPTIKGYELELRMLFQRLHTRETYEGAGISLAHCRKVAELHRDSISIDFKVDVGTTFNISIPYL
ncbi:MAG: chemotaxis family two-component system sensor kinase Cph1 [Sphingobacteriales bacterium]